MTQDDKDRRDRPAGADRLRRPALYASGLLALAIVVVALLPENPGAPGWDGVDHFLAFAALTLCAALLAAGALPWLLAGVVAFGGLLELVQPYFGRNADWSDFLADVAGAIAGLVTALALRRILARRARPPVRTGPRR